MIINRKKKFIFFANKKTASTSIAIALSSSCGKGDVITPLGKDESIRRELGYTSPRNFIPWRNKPRHYLIELRSKLTHSSANESLKRIGLHTHISVGDALSNKYISPYQMDNYFSFCFIRNPWDHALSQYFWMKHGSKNQLLSLDEFIHGGKLEAWAKECRSIYTLDNRVRVSRVCKYENAQREIDAIFNELCLTGNPELPKAKGDIRKDRRSYRDILSEQQAKTIASLFENEIDLGSYQY